MKRKPYQMSERHSLSLLFAVVFATSLVRHFLEFFARHIHRDVLRHTSIMDWVTLEYQNNGGHL